MNTQHPSQIPQNMMASFFLHPDFKQIEPKSLYPQQYIPTPYDLMAYRIQAMKYAQMMESQKYHESTDIKAESPVKFEAKYEHVPKTEPSENDLLCDESVTTTPSNIDPTPLKADFKAEVERIIRFLLSNMGKDNEQLIKTTRNCYLYNSCLLEIYDKISMKYYSAKKCKEDLIRYILRKIFRHIRLSIMNKEKVSSKKATLIMCKRYFQADVELSDADAEDEEKVLKSLMPYNKHSKNKTMNISFILEIFSSASFCKEYQDFLPTLNTHIVEDNKKKEKKLVSFILECVEKKCMEKIGGSRRLPWLDVWTEDAKNLAIAIMPNKRLIYNAKKTKY